MKNLCRCGHFRMMHYAQESIGIINTCIGYKLKEYSCGCKKYEPSDNLEWVQWYAEQNKKATA